MKSSHKVYLTGGREFGTRHDAREYALHLILRKRVLQLLYLRTSAKNETDLLTAGEFASRALSGEFRRAISRSVARGALTVTEAPFAFGLRFRMAAQVLPSRK